MAEETAKSEVARVGRECAKSLVSTATEAGRTIIKAWPLTTPVEQRRQLVHLRRALDQAIACLDFATSEEEG